MNGICRFNHIRIYIATFLILKDAILLEINNDVETHFKRIQYKGSFFFNYVEFGFEILIYKSYYV